MSQSPTENSCLNCGTPYDDAEYCSRCGQQHRAPVRSVGDLFRQYLDEVFSLDSRLTRSLGTLFRHPGRLTTEYLRGRRVRYVRPLRLYLLSSLLFFLVLNWSQGEIRIQTSGFDDSATTSSELGAEASADTTEFDASAVRAVPLVGGLLERRLRRLAEMEPDDRNRAIGHAVAANLPKGVFALLPVFALALKLVYVRRNRGYVEHFIFALHVHAFAFLVALPGIAAGNNVLRWIALIVVAGYIFAAMRHVYGQSRLKTAVKFALLSVSYGILLGVAMATTAVFSALTL